MHSCAFDDFLEHADIQSLFGKFAVVLTDPPYNTRREAGAASSNYDKLSLCPP
jgi:16S rRNA G966 N2-methylase RsmD